MEAPMHEHRGCNVCREWKPWSAFTPQPSGRDGRKSWCKDCVRTRPERRDALKRYRQTAKCKAQQSRYERGTGYARTREDAWKLQGVDPEFKWHDYQRMLESQQGRCAIAGCTRKPTDLDHEHSTGRPRGVLCRLHNQALGHFKEDTQAMQSAVAYLQRSR